MQWFSKVSWRKNTLLHQSQRVFSPLLYFCQVQSLKPQRSLVSFPFLQRQIQSLLQLFLCSILATRLDLATVCYLLTSWLTFLVLVYLLGCVSYLCVTVLHLFHWWSQWLGFLQKRMCPLSSWSTVVHIENPSIIPFQHFLISLPWPQNVGSL